MPRPNVKRVRDDLLAWYDRHARTLPWRAPPGWTADPYTVWLSEIMLQQTTVVTVGPYFDNFMARWPSVNDLAAASLDEVLVAWQGLGYYARARNLHKCAGVVANEYGGYFPDTEAELLKLPGVGPYTAAAVACIAFDRACVPVDGNIERVVARLHDIRTRMPDAKLEIRAAAGTYADAHRPGDFAQAMMDLGATVCTPVNPSCGRCPIEAACLARKAGDPAALPVRAAKKTRPERAAVFFWLQRDDGAVLLRKRPERGLLGGMTELPSTPWEGADWPDAGELTSAQPIETDWGDVDGEAEHVFTHFRLRMRLRRARIAKGESMNVEGLWVHPCDFADHALPTAIKKVMKLADVPVSGR